MSWKQQEEYEVWEELEECYKYLKEQQGSEKTVRKEKVNR